jgi:ribosomal small subunit protein bTHX
MGRGDKRTRKGKISAGSNGKTRLRKKKIISEKKKAAAKKPAKK